jgi:uncharacterized SAM-binding protein YcdF (DUF218 family)
VNADPDVDDVDEYDGDMLGDGRPKRRIGPPEPIRWRRVVSGVLLVLLGYYAISLVQVVWAGRGHVPERAGAIVVLGAAQYDGRPSLQLAARLDHVITLWNDGVSPYVMVTGGKQPGDRFTEAEASTEYLVDHGVPADRILREDVGRTTYESLAAAAPVLHAAAIDDVVLVTDPYHALRSRLIAEEVGLDASVSPTPSSVVGRWTSFRHQLLEAGGVAVGRIIGFERLSSLTG